MLIIKPSRLTHRLFLQTATHLIVQNQTPELLRHLRRIFRISIKRGFATRFPETTSRRSQDRNPRTKSLQNRNAKSLEKGRINRPVRHLTYRRQIGKVDILEEKNRQMQPSGFPLHQFRIAASPPDNDQRNIKRTQLQRRQKIREILPRFNRPDIQQKHIGKGIFLSHTILFLLRHLLPETGITALIYDFDFTFVRPEEANTIPLRLFADSHHDIGDLAGIPAFAAEEEPICRRIEFGITFKNGIVNRDYRPHRQTMDAERQFATQPMIPLNLQIPHLR